MVGQNRASTFRSTPYCEVRLELGSASDFAQLRSQRRIIEGRGAPLHAAQGINERSGDAIAAQCFQGQEAVFGWTVGMIIRLKARALNYADGSYRGASTATVTK
jgi:hypothetical protein